MKKYKILLLPLAEEMGGGIKVIAEKYPDIFDFIDEYLDDEEKDITWEDAERVKAMLDDAGEEDAKTPVAYFDTLEDARKAVSIFLTQFNKIFTRKSFQRENYKNAPEIYQECEFEIVEVDI